MDQQVDEVVEQVYVALATYGLDVVGALAIIVGGLFAAGWAGRAAERGLRRTGRVDPTITAFVASLVRYAVIAVVVIAALQQFGVEATSLVALFGAGALAIGLALQGTLSNVAAGVMLLLFRPFRVGDYIEAGGQAGTVREVGLFTTELATPDNVKIVLPNGQIWGQAVKNFSANPTRRVDLVVSVDYGDDLDRATATIGRVLAQESRALADPPPVVAVAEMGESSVDIIARVWVNTPDYWAVRWDLIKALKEQIEADGMTIPFPQRTVHTVAAAQ